MSYWNDIKNNKITSKTKKRFARFSQGVFEKEPISFSLRGKKLTIKCGVFDESELLEIISKLTNIAKVDGKFITKAELPFPNQYDKKKKTFIYEIKDEINLDELLEHHGFFLGTIEFPYGVLKTKASLPKISKMDDNFAKLTLNLDENVLKIIKEVYELPEFKNLKGKIKYTIYIDSIEIPKDIDINSEDVRELAKRKGKIKRILEFDKVIEESLPFEI